MAGMVARAALIFAALSGGSAVAAGAYASHGLTDPHAIDLFRLASQYQLVHGLALLAVVALSVRSPIGWFRRWLGLAGFAFALGILLFCGALYGTALDPGIGFGRAAPVGGISFMAGWLALAVAGLAARDHFPSG